MARKKEKKPYAFFAPWRHRGRRIDASANRRIGRWLRAGAVLASVGASALGLVRLERSVRASGPQRLPARIVLVDVPDHLDGVMKASVASFAEVPWSSPTLCADLARALERVAWVKEVMRVHRFADRRVEIECTYRRPAALVQTDLGFYLVDEDCVRLPGRYANHPSLTLVQGVAVAAPPPGREWVAPELRAGVELVKLLAPESFAGQISAVLVHNFGGRVDARAAHIELATDRAGGRIIWGSAPGEEIEENSVVQKLELLRANYRRFGRADAGRAVIDVSVHPDRIIAPA